jgi:hypothetical protein
MRLALLAAGVAAAWTITASALAQDRTSSSSVAAREATDLAQLAPFSRATEGSNAVKLRGGYDGAAAQYDLHAEGSAQLLKWLTLQAGASYDALGTEARPFVVGRLLLLEQARAGFSLAGIGGFEARGFNTQPDVVVGAAIARRFGALSLLSNITYGQSTASAERNGAMSLAALYRLTDRLQAGLDSQGQIDLERDANEPAGELDWRALAGPFSTVTFGAFAVTLGGGVSALRYRLAPAIASGAMAYAGVGTVL